MLCTIWFTFDVGERNSALFFAHPVYSLGWCYRNSIPIWMKASWHGRRMVFSSSPFAFWTIQYCVRNEKSIPILFFCIFIDHFGLRMCSRGLEEGGGCKTENSKSLVQCRYNAWQNKRMLFRFCIERRKEWVWGKDTFWMLDAVWQKCFPPRARDEGGFMTYRKHTLAIFIPCFITCLPYVNPFSLCVCGLFAGQGEFRGWKNGGFTKECRLRLLTFFLPRRFT